MRFAWRRVDCASFACAIQYEHQASQTTAYQNGVLRTYAYAPPGEHTETCLGSQELSSATTHTLFESHYSHTKPPNVMNV
jgi:hypothetical protein